MVDTRTSNYVERKIQEGNSFASNYGERKVQDDLAMRSNYYKERGKNSEREKRKRKRKEKRKFPILPTFACLPHHPLASFDRPDRKASVSEEFLFSGENNGLDGFYGLLWVELYHLFSVASGLYL